jgi:hypothetical protein
MAQTMDTRVGAGYAASWMFEGMSGETTVTEAEWLACTHAAMLNYLEGRTSERKLRLLACAFCRRVWHLLPKEVCRETVEVAERYADAQADDRQLHDANRAVWEASRWLAGTSAAFASAVGYASDAIVSPLYASYSLTVERTQLRSLCRELFGPLPFHPINITPDVRAWNDSIVVRLAQTAYEERHLPEGTLDESRLAILADALEEAGCTDADILSHLRSPGPHVRGCWPLDLCLGTS